MQLSGRPSDEVAEVLATGRGEITTLFVSMATRHPDGNDADYLRWHTLDHRPEQHRLAAVRASLRLVSTPACRAARAVGDGPLDAVDHVMTYFFTDASGLRGFNELSTALGDAGRKVPLLPPVQRGVYDVGRKVAAPRVKVGADVLPWLPVPARCCWWSGDRRRSIRWSRSTASPGRGRRRPGGSSPIPATRNKTSRSPTALSTTTRSRPPSGCGRR